MGVGVREKASSEQSAPGSKPCACCGCGRVVHNLITSYPPLLRQERHAVDRGTPSQALFDTGL